MQELLVKSLVLGVVVLIVGLLVMQFLPQFVPSLVSDDPADWNKHNLKQWCLFTTGVLSCLAVRALDVYYCAARS